MREWQSLAHVKWECKYPVVIVPKYRRKALFGHMRKRLGNIFRSSVARRRLSWWRVMHCWTTCIGY
jgi:putative transposase